MNLPLGQLGKSRLIEWLIAYLAFAWLVVQIVDVIADVWKKLAVCRVSFRSLLADDNESVRSVRSDGRGL